MYGNNVETKYAYDWAEHLTTLSTKSGETALQDLAYDWYGRPNTGGLNIGAIRDNRANKIVLDAFGNLTTPTRPRRTRTTRCTG